MDRTIEIIIAKDEKMRSWINKYQEIRPMVEKPRQAPDSKLKRSHAVPIRFEDRFYN